MTVSLGSLVAPRTGLGVLNALSALSVQQTYNLARQAGFDEQHARQMVAIAQRESSLNPGVVGTISPNERSYGLWQINTKDPQVWARVQAATGITSPEQLKDPLTNAKAAYALWNGNDNNLNIAWAINRNTNAIPYKDRYLANLNQLPSTSSLEAVYDANGNVVNGVNANVNTGNPDWIEPYLWPDASGDDASASTALLAALAAVAVYFAVS